MGATAAVAHRGLAWLFILLAFVGWVLLLSGVASLQQARCRGRPLAAAVPRRRGACPPLLAFFVRLSLLEPILPSLIVPLLISSRSHVTEALRPWPGWSREGAPSSRALRTRSWARVRAGPRRHLGCALKGGRALLVTAPMACLPSGGQRAAYALRACWHVPVSIRPSCFHAHCASSSPPPNACAVGYLVRATAAESTGSRVGKWWMLHAACCARAACRVLPLLHAARVPHAACCPCSTACRPSRLRPSRPAPAPPCCLPPSSSGPCGLQQDLLLHLVDYGR